MPGRWVFSRWSPFHANHGISIAMLSSMRQNTIWKADMVSDISRTELCVSENRNIDSTAMMTPFSTAEDLEDTAEPPFDSMRQNTGFGRVQAIQIRDPAIQPVLLCLFLRSLRFPLGDVVSGNKDDRRPQPDEFVRNLGKQDEAEQCRERQAQKIKRGDQAGFRLF